VLGSDFLCRIQYPSGSPSTVLGPLLTRLHDLKDDFPQDEALRIWLRTSKPSMSKRSLTTATRSSLSPRQLDRVRVAQQHAFEQRLWNSASRMSTRLPRKHLMQTVEHFYPNSLSSCCAWGSCPQQPRRAQRTPSVIARKIAAARAVLRLRDPHGLASLFGTWMAQSLNPSPNAFASLLS